MIEAMHASGHTAGYAFRLLSLGFAAFVLGVGGGMAIAYAKGRFPRRLPQREWLLIASVLIFVAGYVAIQIEAIFLNPDAVLLWGNVAFPLGLAMALFWEIVLIQLLTDPMMQRWRRRSQRERHDPLPPAGGQVEDDRSPPSDERLEKGD